MQGIYVDIKDVIVLINDANSFLEFSIGLNFLQPTVHTHSMIDVRYVVAGLQFTKSAERYGFTFIVCLPDVILMITLKYFVIGITNDFQILINKSFMNGGSNGIKIYFRFQLIKDAVESF